MAINQKLTNIANAIRSKTGGTSQLTLAEMAAEINTLNELFSVTNILTTAVDVDGTPYNGGIGYKTGFRLNTSGEESAFTDYCVSGYIPVGNGDNIRIINIGEVTGYSILIFGYGADFTVFGSSICGLNPVTSGHGNALLSVKITSSSVKYIRFAFNVARKDDVIVTKNEIISPLEV